MRLTLGLLAGILIILAEKFIIEWAVNKGEARWHKVFGK